MNTTSGGVRASRLTRATAVAMAAMLAGGLAAATALPATASTAVPATTAAATVNQPLLREGSRGAAVQDWQATLNKRSGKGMPAQAAIAADGVFGPKTKAATQAFQRWAHIPADGIVGVQTYTAAAHALG